MNGGASTGHQQPRLGGELPLFSDRFRRQPPWPPNWLAFSHGRAALAWLIERKKLKSALVCAYTCPSVPEFLQRVRLRVSFYDVGAGLDDIVALAEPSRGPILVLLPALFGSPPLQDAVQLAKKLGRSAVVVIDAAQTAFGHRDFRPPTGGATLSCPRKTTALCDGAMLSLGRGLAAGRGTATLPIAGEAAAFKHAARALWATRRTDLEMQAVELNRLSEREWPDGVHRMTGDSRALLERLDARWHKTVRRRNSRILAKAIAGHIASWSPSQGTPFSLPVFVREPDAFIGALRKGRIFANRLWPDAEHDPKLHPAAAYMVRHLVSLPVDQRHDEADMARIAAAALRAKPRPAPLPPAALRRLIKL